MAGSVHVKIDYAEAVYLKKEVLLLEKSLLEVIKHSRNYNLLRKREFILKSKVKKDLETTEKTLFSIDSDLPKEELIEMNLIQKKSEKPLVREIRGIRPQKQIKERTITEKERKRNDIEMQIQDIQEKLARLG